MEWPIVLVFTALLVAVLLYYFARKDKNHFWVDKRLPFQPPFSYIEGLQAILSGKLYWITDREWCTKHGRIFGCYQAGQPTLYVTDPEVIRRILVKDFHMLPDRRTFKMQDPIANKFLTTLAGEDWKRVRSVITPAFSTGKLKKMVGLMEECAVTTVHNFIRAAEHGEVLDCKKSFGGFTMDVIASTAFGTKLNSAQDPDNVFVQHARALFNLKFPWRFIAIALFPRISNLLGLRAFSPFVMDFFVDLTNTVIQKRKETKEDRGDFLQNLLDAQMNGLNSTGQVTEQDYLHDEKDIPSEECQSFLKQYSKNKTISSEELVAACVLFFLGGFDTTATTLAMTAYYLALNPECQEKVIQEVDEVAKINPNPDYEVLSKLKYMEAAVSETLRLVPPTPRVERKAVQDYYIPEADFKVSKDLIVGFPIYAIHTDPEFFPNPEKYDPERFLPGNKEQVRPYTYLPFGAGPRNCLGMRFALMEIKLCLFHLFKHVTFEPCAETKIPPEIYLGSGLYQPKNVNLKVIERIPA